MHINTTKKYVASLLAECAFHMNTWYDNLTIYFTLNDHYVQIWSWRKDMHCWNPCSLRRRSNCDVQVQLIPPPALRLNYGNFPSPLKKSFLEIVFGKRNINISFYLFFNGLRNKPSVFVISGQKMNGYVIT